ncbi:DUF4350 domain-containing protein [Pseudomonas cavernicola]|uniref:DUF4350 domain-containing protein n=1 Tax=Pseudomonas cavernicola TaxID=2320866 RepID=A0A418XP08_9PSED|nr:DUF4350 domain-containing protein [Pseudomonas cavernicola]RJG14252.1 DUF4350 domain-containing protein [Pseudomonas cavernicola]
MSRRTSFFLGAGLFLALGLLGIYLLSRVSPYQTTIKHGPAPEVAANPYLAAEHFLRSRGLSVQRTDGLEVLPSLPSQGQTLLLLGARKHMTPRQAERVLEWAAKGGHLLFVAERVWDEDAGKSGDLLLDRLEIQQSLTEDLDEEDEETSEADADSAQAPADQNAASEEDNAASAPSNEQAPDADESSPTDEQSVDEDRYPELTKLYLENEKAPAYISFDTDFHLYDAKNQAQAWANSSDSTHMLQLNHGDGLITVLTDSWIWQNRDIGNYDNAWLLWYLTQDSAVTLLYRADHDDLASLLLRNFPEALVALALLIALTLWSVGLRQGPLQAPASRARRQLAEHLRGSADFIRRCSGQQSLLQALQRDIQRQARRRHPGFERLDVAAQWQILARLTRLPTSAISQAMRPLPPQRLSATDFTRQVAHLQTLRNAL